MSNGGGVAEEVGEVRCAWTQVGPHGRWQETMPVWAMLELEAIKRQVAVGHWGGPAPTGEVLVGHLLQAGELVEDGEVLAPADTRPSVYEARIRFSDGRVRTVNLWKDTFCDLLRDR